MRRLVAAAAVLLASCAAESRDPVERWVESGFALKLSNSASTSGEATASLDLAEFRALTVGMTRVSVPALSLEVLDFDPTTPTQLASGELSLSGSEGGAAGFNAPFRDLPVGENGRKDVSVEASAQDATALLLGKTSAALTLKYALDVVPARFNLRVRVKLRAEEAP